MSIAISKRICEDYASNRKTFSCEDTEIRMKRQTRSWTNRDTDMMLIRSLVKRFFSASYNSKGLTQ